MERHRGTEEELAMQPAQFKGDKWINGPADGAFIQTVPAVIKHNRGGPN